MGEEHGYNSLRAYEGSSDTELHTICLAHAFLSCSHHASWLADTAVSSAGTLHLCLMHTPCLPDCSALGPGIWAPCWAGCGIRGIMPRLRWSALHTDHWLQALEPLCVRPEEFTPCTNSLTNTSGGHPLLRRNLKSIGTETFLPCMQTRIVEILMVRQPRSFCSLHFRSLMGLRCRAAKIDNKNKLLAKQTLLCAQIRIVEVLMARQPYLLPATSADARRVREAAVDDFFVNCRCARAWRGGLLHV